MPGTSLSLSSDVDNLRFRVLVPPFPTIEGDFDAICPFLLLQLLDTLLWQRTLKNEIAPRLGVGAVRGLLRGDSELLGGCGSGYVHVSLENSQRVACFAPGRSQVTMLNQRL